MLMNGLAMISSAGAAQDGNAASYIPDVGEEVRWLHEVFTDA
jgi:hypothetical protein